MPPEIATLIQVAPFLICWRTALANSARAIGFEKTVPAGGRDDLARRLDTRPSAVPPSIAAFEREVTAVLFADQAHSRDACIQ